jgi:hypothetical protein
MSTRPADLPTSTTAGEALAAYTARTAGHRSVLLPPGGPVVSGPVPGGSGDRLDPRATSEKLLTVAGEWWADVAALAGRLDEIAGSNPGDQEVAGRILSDEAGQVLRARSAVITAFATSALGPVAALPAIGEDGTVMVGGRRIMLTGVAAAGPPPREPEISLSIGEGSDPRAVAVKLRELADSVEASGTYPSSVR